MLDFSATPLAPSCRFLQNEVEDSSLFLRISQDLGNVKGFTDGLNGLNRMLLAYPSSSSKINPATVSPIYRRHMRLSKTYEHLKILKLVQVTFFLYSLLATSP